MLSCGLEYNALVPCNAADVAAASVSTALATGKLLLSLLS
jgi:hypothetical protein